MSKNSVSAKKRMEIVAEAYATKAIQGRTVKRKADRIRWLQAHGDFDAGARFGFRYAKKLFKEGKLK